MHEKPVDFMINCEWYFQALLVPIPDAIRVGKEES
jgi:hypothetical protein